MPADEPACDRDSLEHRNASDTVPSDLTVYNSRLLLSINDQNMVVNETSEMQGDEEGVEFKQAVEIFHCDSDKEKSWVSN